MIILLNGSINAGKSTVAKLLAQKLSDSIVVEPDDFDKKRDLPLDKRFKRNLADALVAVKAVVRVGKSCIVPYPLSQRSYDFVVDELKDLDQKIFAFTLNPGLEIASVNRGTRELTSWERDRIKIHHDTGIHQPKFGVIIDSSRQTSEETAEEIFGMLK